MELREYAAILARRWWIPMATVVLVALVSAVQLRPWQQAPVRYTSSFRLLVGVLPLAEADIADYDPRYYAWLTSEYLVDDFTEVVGSELFAGGVNQRLAERGLMLPVGAISGSATTGRQHRILRLSLSWGNAEELRAIAQAAADELAENASVYFRQLGTENAVVTLLDQPSITAVRPDLRRQVEFPLRLILALIAGVVLVFVLDYLDDSVRHSRDLEALEIRVVGVVGKK